MTTQKSKTTKPKPGQESGQVSVIQQVADEQIENESRRMLPAVSPMMLLDKAIDRDMDVTRLKEFMDLQERYEANKARKEFTLAFAKFQAMLPEITKEKKVDFAPNNGGQRVKYSYASLASIIKQIGKPLAECGLTYRWEPSEENGRTRITCFLEHIGGHSKSAWLSAPDDTTGGKNSIQAHGSTVSYLKRYTLTSVLGIGTADDDADGQQPKKEAPKPVVKQEPVEQPVPELSDEMQLVIAECNSSPELDEVWKHNKQMHADQSFILAIAIRRAELTQTIEDLQMQWNLNASLHSFKKYKGAIINRKTELGVKS